jgi:serpin B
VPYRKFTLTLLCAAIVQVRATADVLIIGDDRLPTYIGPGLTEPQPIAPHVRSPLSADAATVVAGSNRFALDIYKQLASSAQPGDNVLVSPFSISTALAMTYAGARGNTARQIADVLGFTLPDDRLHSAFGELVRDLDADREGYQLSIANRLFGQNGYPFKQSFLDITERDYGAPLEIVDFVREPEPARGRINDWVADETHDKIPGLFPPGSIHQYSRLVLTNAIYFNGSWKDKFDEKLTRKETFFSAGGPIPAVMMFQQGSFLYAERPGFQMLEMPYAGDDLSMVVLLPDERDGLRTLETLVTPQLFQESLTALDRVTVKVHFPKFTFDSSFELGDALEELGMTDAFDPYHADLTGIADPSPNNLYIGTGLHKAFIDVNEEGTEAAAATGFGIFTTCLCTPPQPKTFRADHPFLFALRDRQSGSLLFLGRVGRPGESTLSAAFGPAVPEPKSLAILAIALLALMTSYRRTV